MRSVHAIVFIVSYIALDAASFIHPLHGLNITPWNPAPALGLVYLLRNGRAGVLPLLIAAVLGELAIRGMPGTWWASLASALLLGLGYVALGYHLRAWLPPLSLLDERPLLLRWMLTVSLGTLLIATLYLSALLAFGLLPAEGWLDGVLRFWIGDAVGIAVLMPLLRWLFLERGRRLLREALGGRDAAVFVGSSVLVLGLAFGLGGGEGFKLFYLLFLPIIWASMRSGMAGAIYSAAWMQASVLLAVKLLDYSAVTIADLQLLTLFMALVGFFIGSVVDAQRRTSEELRQTLRLAAAGEMAGALAHELNQPLTALSAYAQACETLLGRGETGELLNQAIKGMLGESRRASEVLRRLRDFVRTGATRLEPVDLRAVIEQALASCRERARRQHVELHYRPAEAPQMLLADALQLEVVLRNLLGNALDAVQEAEQVPAWVRLTCEALPGERLQVCVEDSGRGLDEARAARLFSAFSSSKSSGLGLGLIISRAIVEIHGGSLWGEVGSHGVFKFVLPAMNPE